MLPLFCLSFCCLLGNELNMVDGLDDSMLPSNVNVRNGFERLRTDFNSRIYRITKDSGVTNLNLVIEYRRTWVNSIVTIAFSPSFMVVANTHNDELDHMKRPLSHAEMEQIESFRVSKWEYRDAIGRYVCDLPRMYAFRIENGKAVSAQCFEQPLLLDAGTTKASREVGSLIFTNRQANSTYGEIEADMSAVSYDRFVNVVRIFRPFVKELQLEIRSRKSGGGKVISTDETK